MAAAWCEGWEVLPACMSTALVTDPDISGGFCTVATAVATSGPPKAWASCANISIANRNLFWRMLLSAKLNLILLLCLTLPTNTWAFGLGTCEAQRIAMLTAMMANIHWTLESMSHACTNLQTASGTGRRKLTASMMTGVIRGRLALASKALLALYASSPKLAPKLVLVTLAKALGNGARMANGWDTRHGRTESFRRTMGVGPKDRQRKSNSILGARCLGGDKDKRQGLAELLERKAVDVAEA